MWSSGCSGSVFRMCHRESFLLARASSQRVGESSKLVCVLVVTLIALAGCPKPIAEVSESRCEARIAVSESQLRATFTGCSENQQADDVESFSSTTEFGSRLGRRDSSIDLVHIAMAPGLTIGDLFEVGPTVTSVLRAGRATVSVGDSSAADVLLRPSGIEACRGAGGNEECKGRVFRSTGGSFVEIEPIFFSSGALACQPPNGERWGKVRCARSASEKEHRCGLTVVESSESTILSQLVSVLDEAHRAGSPVLFALQEWSGREAELVCGRGSSDQ